VAKVKKRGRVRRSATKKAGKKKNAPSGASKKTVATFKVRELDPVSKCGAGTSVRRLFRIDEPAAAHFKGNVKQNWPFKTNVKVPTAVELK